MSNILIVEDEGLIAKVLKKFFDKSNHNTTILPNPIEALEFLKSDEGDKIDVILTDLNLPELNGIEFISKVRFDLKNEMPIMVMSGNIDRHDISKAVNLDVCAFFNKPFNRKEVLDKINNLSQTKTKLLSRKLSEAKPEDFVGVSIRDFYSHSEAGYDIYIKMSEQKYLKIMKKGDPIDMSRIDSYANKDVDFLYAYKKDHRDYLESQITFLKSEETSDPVQKKKHIEQMNKIVLDEVYNSDIDQELFDNSVEVARGNVDMILDNSSLLKLISELSKYNNHLYKHCVAVNIFSILLAKKLNWMSEANMTKLSLAALYHDSGKKWLPKDILQKSPDELTKEEEIQYYRHPEHGTEILAGLKYVPEDILKIILEHHETYDGEGFPNGKRGKRIHPLARVLTIADKYAEYTINSNKSKVLTHSQAIKKMKEEKFKYDTEYLAKFESIFSSNM